MDHLILITIIGFVGLALLLDHWHKERMDLLRKQEQRRVEAEEQRDRMFKYLLRHHDYHHVYLRKILLANETEREALREDFQPARPFYGTDGAYDNL